MVSSGRKKIEKLVSVVSIMINKDLKRSEYNSPGHPCPRPYPLSSPRAGNVSEMIPEPCGTHPSVKRKE